LSRKFKGIVVGSMTKMKTTIFLGEKCTNYRGYYQNYNIPIIYNFPAGTYRQQSIDFR
jgi:muramoyltetrapeptide carboxypeptidase LdcA involved in peptidoglycan recycling